MHAGRTARGGMKPVRRRHVRPDGRTMRINYPVGPSWQDCGPAGESWRQVGTSHFEQAASESPTRSEATIGTQRVMRSRTRRPPLARTLVRIRKIPRTHAHAPHYSAMPQDCDLLAAPEWEGNAADTQEGASGPVFGYIFRLYLMWFDGEIHCLTTRFNDRGNAHGR